jgi:hypothetical protein
MKKWLEKKKFQWALKIITNAGLTPCEIIHRSGTYYIRASDGSLRKIGR